MYQNELLIRNIKKLRFNLQNAFLNRYVALEYTKMNEEVDGARVRLINGYINSKVSMLSELRHISSQYYFVPYLYQTEDYQKAFDKFYDCYEQLNYRRGPEKCILALALSLNSNDLKNDVLKIKLINQHLNKPNKYIKKCINVSYLEKFINSELDFQVICDRINDYDVILDPLIKNKHIRLDLAKLFTAYNTSTDEQQKIIDLYIAMKNNGFKVDHGIGLLLELSNLHLPTNDVIDILNNKILDMKKYRYFKSFYLRKSQLHTLALVEIIRERIELDQSLISQSCARLVYKSNLIGLIILAITLCNLAILYYPG